MKRPIIHDITYSSEDVNHNRANLITIRDAAIAHDSLVWAAVLSISIALLNKLATEIAADEIPF